MENYFSFDGSTDACCKVNNISNDNNEIYLNNSNSKIPRGSGLSPRLLSAKTDFEVIRNNNNKLLEINKIEKTIRVSSNVTLMEINKFSFNYGLELPVISHPKVQVGGAIACCVHGKNQYLYDFGDNIYSIKLLLHNNELIYCNANNNKLIYDLTIGGYGSTGLILEAELKLIEVKNTCIQRSRNRINNLKEITKNYNDNNIINLHGIFSWHDLHGGDKKFGSGFEYRDEKINPIIIDMPNNYGLDNTIESNKVSKYYSIGNFIFGKKFNSLYKIKENFSGSKRIINSYGGEFTSKNIYWNIMRSSGFIEVQLIVPFDKFDEFSNFIKFNIKKFNAKTSVCITKASKGIRKYLRFSGNGVNIDIAGIKNENNYYFFSEINKFCRLYSAIPNISKCSILKKEIIISSYGEQCALFYSDYKKALGKNPPEWFLNVGYLDKY